MASPIRTRTTAFVINKLEGSEKFKTFLAASSSSMEHFSTTLNQEGSYFMQLYNELHMQQFSGSPEQVEFRLTTSVKLAFLVLINLVKKQFAVEFDSREMVEAMLNYQLPILRKADMRFYDADKIAMMAAVWYSYHTSPRQFTVEAELAEDFYDVLWFFLEFNNASTNKPTPIVDFDRTAFSIFISEQLNMNKPATTTAPAMAPVENVSAKAAEQQQPQPNIIPFGAKAEYEFNVTRNQAVKQGAVKNDKDFARVLKKQRELTTATMMSPDIVKWENTLLAKLTGNNFFSPSQVSAAVQPIASLPDFTNVFIFVMNNVFFDTLWNVAFTRLENTGYTLVNTNTPASEIAEYAEFIVGIGRSLKFPQIDKKPITLGELHLRVGQQILVISELLAKGIFMHHQDLSTPDENTGQKNKDALADLTITIAEIITAACRDAMFDFEIKTGNRDASSPAGFKELSIFTVGAKHFYHNVHSIITKETEMTAAATQRTESAANTNALPPEIQAMMGQLQTNVDQSIKNGFTQLKIEMESELKSIEGRLQNSVGMSALDRRISDLEKVTATGGRAHGDEATKALKRIKKGAKEAVKEAKKAAREDNTPATSVYSMTPTETVLTFTGIAAVGGLTCLGVYHAAQWLLGGEEA